MIKKLLITSVLAGCMSVGWADECKEMFNKIDQKKQLDLYSIGKEDVDGHISVDEYVEPHCEDFIFTVKVNALIEYSDICKGISDSQLTDLGDVKLDVKLDDGLKTATFAVFLDVEKDNVSLENSGCQEGTFDLIQGDIFLSHDYEKIQRSSEAHTW